MASLLIPLLLGTFIAGMNLIRNVQVNHATRDMADMYIHGADFSSYPMQVLAQRLARGLDLQIGNTFSGNNATNTNNAGKGIVTISQIMFIGSTTSPSCVVVGASNCTNHDKFVFTQRIQFGNGTLATSFPSSLGNPAVTPSSYGIVSNVVTDSRAALPGNAQTEMQALWQTSAGGRTPLIDGQTVYVVESYFKSPDFAIGKSTGGGVYARYFY